MAVKNLLHKLVVLQQIEPPRVNCFFSTPSWANADDGSSPNTGTVSRRLFILTVPFAEANVNESQQRGGAPPAGPVSLRLRGGTNAFFRKTSHLQTICSAMPGRLTRRAAIGLDPSRVRRLCSGERYSDFCGSSTGRFVRRGLFLRQFPFCLRFRTPSLWRWPRHSPLGQLRSRPSTVGCFCRLNIFGARQQFRDFDHFLHGPALCPYTLSSGACS